MKINLELFSNMAKQVMTAPTSRTSVQNLGKVVFQDAGRKIIAIQQNPNTGSVWAHAAQKGKQVVQFKDTTTQRYVAVSVDGQVRPYGDHQ